MTAQPPKAGRLDGRQLAVCAFCVFAPIGVQLPFFPLWLFAQGFSSTGVALLLGISPVVRFASNLLIPPRADRRGDAAGILLTCAAFAAAAQALSGAPLGIAWIFALSLVVAAGQGPMVPLLDSIILQEVRRRAELREPPLDYSRIRGFGSVAVLLIMLASGGVAAITPASSIIWLMTSTSAAAALAVAFLLPRGRTRFSDDWPVSSERPPHHARLICLIIAASSAVQASHGMLYAFGSIGWRDAGFGDGAIGLLWASGVATEVALFVFGNRLARGRSLSYAFLVGGSAVAVLRWLIMATDPAPLLLSAAQLLHAGSFAATYLGAVVAISTLAGEGRRAQVQGWVSAANALTLAAVTVASGPLWSALGMRAYLFPAALATIGLACSLGATVLRHPHTAAAGGQTVDPS